MGSAMVNPTVSGLGFRVTQHVLFLLAVALSLAAMPALAQTEPSPQCPFDCECNRPNCDCDPTGWGCYEPLPCRKKSDCACKGGAQPECGFCPLDGGSKNRFVNVCHCYDERALGGKGLECSPKKPFGPYLAKGKPAGVGANSTSSPAPATSAPSTTAPLDLASAKCSFECDCGAKPVCDCDSTGWGCYEPLECSKTSECACKQGARPECGKCPADKGSSSVDKNVCFCHEKRALGAAEVECMPKKPFGPYLVTGSPVGFGTGNDTGNSTATSVPTTTVDIATRKDETEASDENSGGSVCFPAEATVELKDGSIVPMHQLSIGDMVKVSTGRFSKVFMFTHKLGDVKHEFVTLETVSGASLSLTKGHYLHADGALVAASEVRVGSTITLGSGGLDRVSKIGTKTASGLYNPQTVDGNVVVNGIVTSTYTTAVDPTVAHAVLAPFRMLNRLGYHFTLFESGGGVLADLAPRGKTVL